MFETVQSTLAELSDDHVILPGHHSDFREINASGFVGEPMKHIRNQNSMLRMSDREQFVNMAVGNAGVTPPNHEVIISLIAVKNGHLMRRKPSLKSDRIDVRSNIEEKSDHARVHDGVEALETSLEEYIWCGVEVQPLRQTEIRWPDYSLPYG